MNYGFHWRTRRFSPFCPENATCRRFPIKSVTRGAAKKCFSFPLLFKIAWWRQEGDKEAAAALAAAAAADSKVAAAAPREKKELGVKNPLECLLGFKCFQIKKRNLMIFCPKHFLYLSTLYCKLSTDSSKHSIRLYPSMVWGVFQITLSLSRQRPTARRPASYNRYGR